MFYSERSQGSPQAVRLCRLQNRSLLSVNEDFEGKRNTENLCKRVKCKVYFAILQRVLPNFGYQIYFLVTPFVLFTTSRTAWLNLLEEVIALVINEDKCREVLNLDFPDSLHTEFGVLDALNALDVVLREDSSRATD